MSEKNSITALCSPDAAQGLCHTDIVRLKLVQTNGGGEGECAQEPVAEAAELGDALRGEVVNNGSPVRGQLLDCDSRFVDPEKIRG